MSSSTGTVEAEGRGAFGLPRWLALGLPEALRSGESAGGEAWRANLTAFRRLVFVHVIVRNLLLIPWDGAFSPGSLLRWAAIATAAAGFAPGFALWAARAIAVLVAIEIGIALPEGTNHVAVEGALMVFFSLLDERKGDERALLVSALRWFVAVFFLYTGVQKLVYGYYFQGQFLAFAAGTEERFAALFRWFMPAEELARLQSYNQVPVRPGVMSPRLGAGPYLVDSTLFVVLSNAVWVFEIVAGAALAIPRLRAASAVAIMLFVVAIEAGARELTFGLLMVNMLLLFLERTWNRRAFWALVVGYVGLIVLETTGLFEFAPA